MKAIILASGVGSRLRPLTHECPKALVKIAGRALIDYQLASLSASGVRDMVVTTGYEGSKLEEHLKRNWSLNVDIVRNPRYETTNYIYTLWLTREIVDDDVILLHGDLLFEDVLVQRLLESTGNRVVVRKDDLHPTKDFKALLSQGTVVKIGVEVDGPEAVSCAPAYRFGREDFRAWLEAIGHYVGEGRVHCFAEDALNEITDRVVLKPLYFDGLCMEIDNIEDLRTATQHAVVRSLPTYSGSAGEGS